MSHELVAGECPNGHLTYPTHDLCPECGDPQEGRVDLSDRTATVVTWTESHSTPPGVRSTNLVAIVEFDVGGETVRAIGGLVEGTAAEDVDTGDEVAPVYVEQLRDPEPGIRDPGCQEWDGFRFEPV
jgi:uncharacterized OB-fold protein